MVSHLDDLTLENCLASCIMAGYTFYQFDPSMLTLECFCGNTPPDEVVDAVTKDHCDTPCPGDSTKKCGGDTKFYNLYRAVSSSVTGTSE